MTFGTSPSRADAIARVVRWAWLACSILWAGCLDPRGDDAVGYSHRILPEGSEVPEAADSELLAGRIEGNDRLSDPEIVLHTGFANGRTVRYWDFGEASTSADPLWRFRRRNGEGPPEDVGHPDLVDTAPGDDGYTPFRAIYVVYVTDAYRGERITSFEALEDALEIGLVEEPVALETYGNYPITRPDARLQLPDGSSAGPVPVYYRGHVARHFPLDDITGLTEKPELRRGRVPAAAAYMLTRQHEPQALDEGVWGFDLNDDGDMLDSQIIFAADREAPDYTALFSRVDVTVHPDYVWGASRAASDLFTEEAWGASANEAVVVTVRDTDTLLNHPIAIEP